MIIRKLKYNITLRKDNIIHIDIISKDAFTSNDFFEVVSSIRDIRNSTNEYYPAIVTTIPDVMPEKEVRDLMSTKLFRKYIVAGAFVSNHMPHRLLANTHLSIYKPAIPTRVFNNKNAALIWLQQFRNN